MIDNDIRLWNVNEWTLLAGNKRAHVPQPEPVEFLWQL